MGHKVFICDKKRPLRPIRALREKMEKECPFILPKKAIKFEKEIEKFLVVKASENFMAAGPTWSGNFTTTGATDGDGWRGAWGKVDSWLNFNALGS